MCENHPEGPVDLAEIQTVARLQGTAKNCKLDIHSFLSCVSALIHLSCMRVFVFFSCVSISVLCICLFAVFDSVSCVFGLISHCEVVIFTLGRGFKMPFGQTHLFSFILVVFDIFHLVGLNTSKEETLIIKD